MDVLTPTVEFGCIVVSFSTSGKKSIRAALRIQFSYNKHLSVTSSNITKYLQVIDFIMVLMFRIKKSGRKNNTIKQFRGFDLDNV